VHREVEIVLVVEPGRAAETSIRAPKVRPAAISGTTIADSIPSSFRMR